MQGLLLVVLTICEFYALLASPVPSSLYEEIEKNVQHKCPYLKPTLTQHEKFLKDCPFETIIHLKDSDIPRKVDEDLCLLYLNNFLYLCDLGESSINRGQTLAQIKKTDQICTLLGKNEFIHPEFQGIATLIIDKMKQKCDYMCIYMDGTLKPICTGIAFLINMTANWTPLLSEDIVKSKPKVTEVGDRSPVHSGLGDENRSVVHSAQKSQVQQKQPEGILVKAMSNANENNIVGTLEQMSDNAVKKNVAHLDKDKLETPIAAKNEPVPSAAVAPAVAAPAVAAAVAPDPKKQLEAIGNKNKETPKTEVVVWHAESDINSADKNILNKSVVHPKVEAHHTDTDKENKDAAGANNIKKNKIDHVPPKSVDRPSAVEETAKPTEVKDDTPESNIQKIPNNDEIDDDKSPEETNSNDDIDLETGDDTDTGNEAEQPNLSEVKQKTPDRPKIRKENNGGSKPLETDEDADVPANYQSQDVDDGDSYFFSYFMMICVMCVCGYVAYHNKQKILALVLEGRKGRKPQRTRRPNSANYHKLDSNLEEAISSSCNKSTTQVIY